MCKDPQMPMTLAIADCQMDLHVISFTGLETLNEVYRFDIDLISTDAPIDPDSLLGRDAFFRFGLSDKGVRGQIHEAEQVDAGIGLTHYRVAVMPELQALARCRRSRAYHGASTPDLIRQLLENHGIANDTYRFEHLTGRYLHRPLCVQYAETDLHFLQRLCEEDGIHFRFEHTAHGPVLVFSDDPVSFPERTSPLRFNPDDMQDAGEPQLFHLAEHRSMRANRTRPARQTGLAVQPMAPPEHPAPDAHAINEPFEQTAAHGWLDHETACLQQRSARALERIRCEHRDIKGCSNQAALRSGEIVHVLDHPEPLFNDHWLLTEVYHTGRQLHLLDGHTAHDTALVISALPEAEPCWPQTIGEKTDGYANEFKVIPWAMSFRAAIRHPRPRINQVHVATLMPGLNDDADIDPSTHRSIRFDWQKDEIPDAPLGRWPLAQVMCSDAYRIGQLRVGARVLVDHLDNDPDRPVIRSIVRKNEAEQDVRVCLEGIDFRSPAYIQLLCNQHLRIESDKGLTLRSSVAQLHLTPDGVCVSGAATLFAPQPTERSPRTLPLSDLRLTTQPGLHGAPLAGRIWYIVRMPEPDLHHLARLAREHFLFEGTTDEHGYLGLSEAQRHRLAKEYHLTPHDLRLFHPGQCVDLHAYFQQNWTHQQLEALRQCGA